MFRKKGVDDLCMAADRSNAGLTDELQARLKAEIIYVYTLTSTLPSLSFTNPLTSVHPIIDQYW
jgi:hypothetical protein